VQIHRFAVETADSQTGEIATPTAPNSDHLHNNALRG
jgi:hypothetical protein